MSYVVLDLEFNQAYDFVKNRTIELIPACRFEIIQIGAVKLDNNFNIKDKINLFIKPKLYKNIHPYVKKITNLTEEFLEDKPSFENAFENFNNFIKYENDITFCIWGSSDLRALYRNLSYYKLLNKHLILKYINVQDMATSYLKYSKGGNIGLKKAIELLNIPIKEEFHDALNDAIYTTKILIKILKTPLPIKIFNSRHIPKK